MADTFATLGGVACAGFGLLAVLAGLGAVAYTALRRAFQRGGRLWCWWRRDEIRAEMARLRAEVEPRPRTAQPTFDQRFDAITAQLGDVEQTARTFYLEAS